MQEVCSNQALDCAARNPLQVGPLLRGAGSIPEAFMISQTVECATLWPSLISSPWIRRWPHRGLSAAIREISALTAGRVDGRWSRVERSLANLAADSLKRLEALVRNRLKSLRHRSCILDGFISGTGLALQPRNSKLSRSVVRVRRSRVR